jgi:hypothetical protein
MKSLAFKLWSGLKVTSGYPTKQLREAIDHFICAYNEQAAPFECRQDGIKQQPFRDNIAYFCKLLLVISIRESFNARLAWLDSLELLPVHFPCGFRKEAASLTQAFHLGDGILVVGLGDTQASASG